MSVNTLNAELLAKMFLAGAKGLESKKEWINDLNVFPVPDGDTGTNMTMTIMSAAKEIKSIQDLDMQSLCKAISSGSLRGARGNSGVILSQIFRGFTKVVAEHEEITIPVLALACEKAVETAYKAVMKPKEGTILTVARGIAEKARELADLGETDMDTFIGKVLVHAEEVLAMTPELLPVLKQAGVVDSGGQGLVVILQSAYDLYLGKEVDFTFVSSQKPEGGTLSRDEISTADIKFGYCTEFIILLENTFNIKHELDFKEFLESIGDSIVVVADDEIVKVHVHTNDPGLAIQRALKYGSLSNMKIDNMRLEHQETLIKEEEKKQFAKDALLVANVERKPMGFISVAAGEGIRAIVESLGVDYVIEGGQTMNPSTEDMLKAIERVHADTIVIFPNNKNIILAANQAAQMTEDKKVIVIPTKTIPQGITAMLAYVPDLSVEENEQAMLEAMTTVASGQVTYAVRDTVIEEHEIKQGDYMGLGDHGILAVSKDRADAVMKVMEKIVSEDTGLISIYYGSEVTNEEAESLSQEISERFPECDVELQYGGQPIYYYIISAE